MRRSASSPSCSPPCSEILRVVRSLKIVVVVAMQPAAAGPVVADLQAARQMVNETPSQDSSVVVAGCHSFECSSDMMSFPTAAVQKHALSRITTRTHPRSPLSPLWPSFPPAQSGNRYRGRPQPPPRNTGCRFLKHGIITIHLSPTIISTHHTFQAIANVPKFSACMSAEWTNAYPGPPFLGGTGCSDAAIGDEA